MSTTAPQAEKIAQDRGPRATRPDKIGCDLESPALAIDSIASRPGLEAETINGWNKSDLTAANQKERLSKADGWTAAAIFAGAFLFTVPGIFIREYYRHTEADRTLIGWEMFERGDLLLPRLLGDYYLTKPPLFYQLLAGSFHLFGGPTEWAARAVTVAAVCLLLPLLYLFYRTCGLDRQISILAVAVMGLCGQVYEYSVIAEIDLTYVFFSSGAIASLFLSVIRPQRALFTAISALFLVLAFFTKGPPVLVFYFSAAGGILLVNLYRTRLPEVVSEVLAVDRRWLLGQGLVGVVLAGLITAWLVKLSSVVGWEEVRAIFNTEVIVRFVHDSKADIRDRGPFFYGGSLLRGFLPWTVLCAGLLSRRGRSAVVRIFSRHAAFVLFCLVVILPSVLIFSLASGKSHRYLLPLYPFIAPFFAFCAAGLPEAANLKLVRRVVGGLALLAAATAAGFFFYAAEIRLEQRLAAFFIAMAAGAGSFFYLFFSQAAAKRAENDAAAGWRQVASVLIVCIVASRYPFSVFFDGTRNNIYSVRPVANYFESAVPPGSTVYIVEMFERWLPYYMKRVGFDLKRLTPDESAKMAFNDSPVYLIINQDYEGWRKDQIQDGGGTMKVLSRFQTEKDHFELIEIRGKDAGLLSPAHLFATVPTQPHK